MLPARSLVGLPREPAEAGEHSLNCMTVAQNC